MVLMPANASDIYLFLKNNTFVGIISIDDVMKSIISNKDLLIDQRINCISGLYLS